MKERRKQKQRERQPDRETMPRPSRESAPVTLVVDPDSKKPRRGRDTERGKEKDGEKAADDDAQRTSYRWPHTC
jgi:hypothetical protein